MRYLRTTGVAGVSLLLILGLAACGAQTTDRQETDVTGQVENALENDPQTRDLDVDVESEDGTIVLTGTVENEQARQRAEQVARNVQGVNMVENRIEVGSTTMGFGQTGEDWRGTDGTNGDQYRTDDRTATTGTNGNQFGTDRDRWEGGMQRDADTTRRLPQTATSLPLIGLLGLIGVLGGAALRVFAR
jgi:hypothetical protein